MAAEQPRCESGTAYANSQLSSHIEKQPDVKVEEIAVEVMTKPVIENVEVFNPKDLRILSTKKTTVTPSPITAMNNSDMFTSGLVITSLSKESKNILH